MTFTMYPHCVFILFVVFGNAFGTDVSDDFGWLDAKDEYNLTTPHLLFKNARVTVNLTGYDVNADNKWIGYIKAFTSMEYFGCVSKSHITQQHPNFTTKGSPGLCMSACGDVPFVGVYKKQCYCFTRNLTINTMERYCDQPCPDQPDILCGGDPGNRKQFLSLYRTIVTDEKYSVHAGEVCMWYDIINGYHWSGCNSFWRIICENDDDVWLSELDIKWLQWNQSTIQCFRNNSRPTSYERASMLYTNESQQFWTGVIRTEVIHGYNNDEDDFIEHLFRQVGTTYGYLKRVHDSIYELDFTSGGIKKSLSWDDMKLLTTTPVPSTSTTMTFKPTLKSISSRKPDITNGPSSPMPTNMTPTTRIYNKTNQSEQTGFMGGMKLWIIVGGSALAAVVLITLTVCMCRRKRRLQEEKRQKRAMEMTNRFQSSRKSSGSLTPDQRPPTKQESQHINTKINFDSVPRNAKRKKHGSRTSNVSPTTDQPHHPTPNQSHNKREGSQHIYTSIDLDSVPKNTKRKKKTKENPTAPLGDVPPTSAQEEDNTYDKTRSTPRKQRTSTDNTYDKLKLEKTSTYDQVKHHKKHRKSDGKSVNDSDNAYDTVEVSQK